jgi:tetratricopeptide (TPR) repeat protein
MKCDEIQQDQLLEKYLDGALDRTQRDALEFHIRLCIGCMTDFENLRAARRGPVAVSKQSFKDMLLAGSGLLISVGVILALALTYFAATRLAVKKTSAYRPPDIHVTIPAGEVKPIRELTTQELGHILPLSYRASTRPLHANVEKRHQEAVQLYTAGRFSQAANAFREVLVIDPNDGHSWCYMGASLAVVGELARSEEALRKVVQKPSDDFQNEARFLLSKVLFAQGKIEEGVATLRPLTAEGNPFAATANRFIALAATLP